jgi:AcrR family transcriptional regulator
VAAVAFSRSGYVATSIDAISDELGATKGRVYHYYRAKVDIFLDVVRSGMDELISTVQPLAAEDRPALDRLREMIRQHARLMMTRHHFQRVTVEAVELHLLRKSPTEHPAFEKLIALRDQYEQLFADVIEEGKAEGTIRDIDSRLATKPLLGALNWISVWYDPRQANPTTVARVAEEHVAFIVGGLEVKRPEYGEDRAGDLSRSMTEANRLGEHDAKQPTSRGEPTRSRGSRER